MKHIKSTNLLFKIIISIAFLESPFTQAAQIAPFTGTKSIELVQQDGKKVVVGSITFNPKENFSEYKINWDYDKFSNQFLSMRPFKCLQGEAKYWCHVPYPYPIKRRVSSTDLTDLEYDLLFLWKGATEYGINMWNGVYYKLKIDGERIVGSINELDMDKLSAPPPKGNFRPIRKQDLEEGEHSSHWLPRVLIE